MSDLTIAIPIDGKLITMDTASALFNSGVIFLDKLIDDKSAHEFMTSIVCLDSCLDSKKTIKVMVNSPGGDVIQALAMYDVMQTIKHRINLIASGECCSAAAMLLGTGKKGHRFAYKNAIIMIHSYSTTITGSGESAKRALVIIDKLFDKFLMMFARSVKKPFKQVKEDCQQDFYLTAAEALKYGIIDGII